MKKTRAWKRRLRQWLSTWYVAWSESAATPPQSPNAPSPDPNRTEAP